MQIKSSLVSDLGLTASSLSAEFKLRNIYSSNMVLQRDVPIKIYGYAEAGEVVKGTFADGKEVTAKTDKNGEFILTFPAMKAGGAYSLVVKNSKNQTIKMDNILIGEVYFSSGQSNMEMPLWSEQEFWRSYKGDEEAKNANFPQIRFVQVPRKILHGQIADNVDQDAVWEVISPETAAPYSAVAYYFAKTMYKELNVPIGIIQCPWSGTLIEPWISKSAYFKYSEKTGIRDFELYDLSHEEREKIYIEISSKWAEKFKNSEPEATAKTVNWKDFNFDDSSWSNINLPNVITTLPGINWLRKTIEIPAEMAGKDLVLSLGEIDDCDETYFNGVKVGSIDITHHEYWKTPRKYKISTNLVKAGKNVIAVRAYNYCGSGGCYGQADLLKLTTEDEKNKIDLAGEWRTKQEFAANFEKIEARPAPLTDQQLEWNSTLYNGMVHPWIVYPIRGVIWYQGCANSGAYVRYLSLFPMLINDWREKWNNPEMPFVFVQLSAFYKHTPAERGGENAWKNIKPLYASGDGFACIRESQTVVLNLPNVGMAVSIDRGDQYDIHPAYKADVGSRLACEAMRISFGEKGITASPYYKTMKVEGDKIRLTFTNADNGFTFDGEKINGFAIGDDQGNWAVADVEIINGNELLVSSAEIKNPTRVRYAFCAYPGDLNLYNLEGFPMAPFRTDLPTYLKK